MGMKVLRWEQGTSEGEPAQATVTAGAHSAGGSPTAGLEMQSHPSPFAPVQNPAPQPAVAVVMPSGLTIPATQQLFFNFALC